MNTQTRETFVTPKGERHRLTVLFSDLVGSTVLGRDMESEHLSELLGQLREILLHNMREEIEHASMLIEWLRRNDETFAKELKEYLFTEKDIVEVEHEAEGKG